MRRYALDTFDFQHEGLNFRAVIETDTDHGAPWKEEEGHGPVSGWTSRSKNPGWRVLHQDRGSYRYYDFAKAVQIAKRDGWGYGGTEPGETKGQIAAKAVEADFERLRAWCNDEWTWCGVVVTMLDEDGDPIDGYEESLWGIESDASEYIKETAQELADQLIATIDAELRMKKA
jgi:hypothetical protein